MAGTENTLGIHLVTFEGNSMVVPPLPKSFESAERFYIVSYLHFQSQKKYPSQYRGISLPTPILKVEIHLDFFSPKVQIIKNAKI